MLDLVFCCSVFLCWSAGLFGPASLGLLRSIAVAVHLKNVDVVGQSVDEGGCVGTNLGGLAVQALWCPVGVAAMATRHMYTHRHVAAVGG